MQRPPRAAPKTWRGGDEHHQQGAQSVLCPTRWSIERGNLVLGKRFVEQQNGQIDWRNFEVSLFGNHPFRTKAPRRPTSPAPPPSRIISTLEARTQVFRSRPPRRREGRYLTVSERMARIRSKGSKIELLTRRTLSDLGVRYRLHRRDLPGTPDLVVGRLRLAIFVNGCWWHGHDCRNGDREARSNVDYWRRKIARNVARDVETRTALAEMGFRVL